MERILFLAHRIPYPPDKGDKIRSWHLLQGLARRYRVLLGAFVDDPDDWRHRAALEAVCETVCLRPLPRVLGMARAARALATGEAITLPWYRDRAMWRWVRYVAETHDPACMVAFSSAMAQYAGALRDDVPLVADFVDVDSEKWAAYGRRRGGLAGWLYRREAGTLAGWEERAAARADAVVLVSESEADLFVARVPEAADKVHAVANGVDLERFAPEGAYEDPFPRGTRRIVFTGLMDYWPNVDAVTWFAREVLPHIRSERPEAHFWIVGARPSEAVRRLASDPGVTVTGAVPDTRPWIAHADVVVAPLRIARGVQNKVLEAFAMARPVVMTAEAAEGIALPPGAEGWIASDAGRMAGHVARLLDEPPAESWRRACRAWLEARYGWSGPQARFTELVAVAAERRGRQVQAAALAETG